MNVFYQHGMPSEINYFFRELSKEVFRILEESRILLTSHFRERFAAELIYAFNTYHVFVQQFYAHRPLLKMIIEKIGLPTKGVYAFIPARSKQSLLADRLREAIRVGRYNKREKLFMKDLLRELNDENPQVSLSSSFRVSDEFLAHMEELARAELSTWLDDKVHGFVPSYQDALGVQWVPYPSSNLFFATRFDHVPQDRSAVFIIGITPETHPWSKVDEVLSGEQLSTIYRFLIMFQWVYCINIKSQNVATIQIPNHFFSKTT
ncbi:MAG: hypothetical protein NZT61_04890 [Deltaproteobacteria bacterium]|nr:hypothetical protein [Deltaproteobacteria bacterium]